MTVQPLGPAKVLCSYHFFRTENLSRIKEGLGSGSMIFGDSGAFSAFTQKVVIDVHDYAAWLHEWSPVLDVYANLDSIGDPHRSRQNLRELERDGLSPLPVFHVGSPFKELESYCEEYRYVALGGMVGRTNLGPWLVKCFQIAARYESRFHGFGLTRRELIEDFPFYSVDSSSWTAGVRFGMVPLWDTSAAKWQRAKVGDKQSVYRVSELVRAHGGDPKRLANRDLYHRSVASLISAVAWLKYERFLRRKHGAIHLRADSGHTSMHATDPLPKAAHGTNVYLADVGFDDAFLTDLARYLKENPR